MSALDNKKCSYVKKNKKISFTFDGKKYSCYKGDTIASALLRNNVRLIARSFKYHRPRGIYTCGIEEPNAIVQILSEHNEPNTRATVKQIYEGMRVSSQNRIRISIKSRYKANHNDGMGKVFSRSFLAICKNKSTRFKK